ncbi:MAG: SRPBCC domain-containing protein [Pseudomonadota bacterium]
MMGIMELRGIFVAAAGMLVAMSSEAEVVASSDTHFRLHQEGLSPLPPAQLWQRLTDPASWWHPDHTYSGAASNLSLDLTAGGLWREDWDGGSVAHGEVLLVHVGRELRLNAPFGPLQGVGAHVVWSITLAPEGEGTRVTFDEVASAAPGAGLAELARAVDFVKSEAMRRLVGAP